MKTLVLPRRVVRPATVRSDLPTACKWCGREIPAAVAHTFGHDLGREAVVCPGCLTPPAIDERPTELTVED